MGASPPQILAKGMPMLMSPTVWYKMSTSQSYAMHKQAETCKFLPVVWATENARKATRDQVARLTMREHLGLTILINSDHTLLLCWFIVTYFFT